MSSTPVSRARRSLRKILITALSLASLAVAEKPAVRNKSAKVVGPAPGNQLHLYKDAAGVVWFAAVLSPAPQTQPPTPIDVALLIDGSANQAGGLLAQTLQRAEQMVRSLPATSTVQVWTSRRPEAPILPTPTTVGEPVFQSLAKLAADTPLGELRPRQLLEAVSDWLTRPSPFPKAVVYVGASREAFRLHAETNEWTALANRFREARTPFFWLTDTSANEAGMLESLSISTGGERLDAKQFGDPTQFAAVLSAPVLYPVEIQFSADIKQWAPQQLLPLRPGRSALLVGSGKIESAFDIAFVGAARSGGKLETWKTRVTGKSTDENAFVKPLAQRWLAEPSKPQSRDGVESLRIARQAAAERTERLLAEANRAFASRRVELAADLYRQVVAEEPANREAEIGLAALSGLPAAGKAPAPNREPNADAIAKAKALEQIELQRLRKLTSDAIRDAQRLAKDDPDSAISLLKQTLITVQAGTEFAPESGKIMQANLEKNLRTLSRLRQRVDRDRNDAGEFARQSQRSALKQDSEREQRTKHLAQRYQFLMQQGRYAESEALAKELANQGDEVLALAVGERAQLARQYEQVEAVEATKKVNWATTLAQVELSSIPMPDEPPIRYPPAKEWEELTLRRAKYQAVDLAPTSEGEEKIRRSLSRPIRLDFSDAPLNEVIDFIRTVTETNIVMDRVGLKEVSIEPDTPVSIQVTDIPVKSALNLLLRPLDLSYTIRDNVLVLTSVTETRNQLITKVYPVADLVIDIPNLSAQAGGIQQGGQGGQQGQGGGQGVGLGNNNNGNNNGNNAGGNRAGGGNRSTGLGVDASQELIDLIQRTVEPEMWEANGGAGRIRAFQHGLVVRANGAGHEKVGEALRGLRDDPPRPPVRELAPKPAKKAQEGDSVSTPPTDKEWDNHFASRRESSSAILAAVAFLSEAKQHEAVAQMLKSALRRQPLPDWAYEALALSVWLSHGDDREIQEAALSLVARRPRDLPRRVAVADLLVDLGQARSAVALLKETEKLFPDSVNTLFRLMSVGQTVGDVDTVARSADRLLSEEWAGQGESVHRKALASLEVFEGQLRQAGDATGADRIRELSQFSQQRDLEVTAKWSGEADVDLYVIEPGDLLCSPAIPRTVHGGVLVSDTMQPTEKYVAAEGFSGTYELGVRSVWGTPTAGVVTLDVIKNKGTKDEQRERHTVALKEGAGVVKITLERGRRQERRLLNPDVQLVDRLDPAKPAAPLAQLRNQLRLGGEGALMQQGAVRGLNAGGIGVARGGSGGASISINRSVPFVAGFNAFAGNGAAGAVAIPGVINEGPSLNVQAIVSHDRRYVRLTLAPMITVVEGFTAFQGGGVVVGGAGVGFGR